MSLKKKFQQTKKRVENISKKTSSEVEPMGSKEYFAEKVIPHMSKEDDTFVVFRDVAWSFFAKLLDLEPSVEEDFNTFFSNYFFEELNLEERGELSFELINLGELLSSSREPEQVYNLLRVLMERYDKE